MSDWEFNVQFKIASDDLSIIKIMLLSEAENQNGGIVLKILK